MLYQDKKLIGIYRKLFTKNFLNRYCPYLACALKISEPLNLTPYEIHYPVAVGNSNLLPQCAATAF